MRGKCLAFVLIAAIIEEDVTQKGGGCIIKAGDAILWSGIK